MRLSVALLLWLVLFELGVRIDDYIQYRTPLFTPFLSQSDLFVRDQDGLHGRSSARFQKFVLNTRGMRSPEFSDRPASGTIRIITIGASETFGLYESMAREYPRQLEDTLNAQLRDGRCACPRVERFEVINAALLGMALPSMVQDIRRRVGKLNANLMILYPSPAQYLNDLAPEAAKPDSTTTEASRLPWTRRLHPRSSERLREQLKLAIPAPILDWFRRRETRKASTDRPAGWRFTEPPQDRLALYARDLEQAIVEVENAGAQPVVVSHANAFAPGRVRDVELMNAWTRFYPRATGDAIVEFEALAAVVTRRIADERRVSFIDWHREVHLTDVRSFRDYGHFTDAGAAALADAIATRVIALIRSAPEPTAEPSGIR